MRRGISVALIGADGAGKTTMARDLAAALPGPTLYLYMGSNPHASLTTLPFNRLINAARRAGGPQTSSGGPRQFDPPGDTESRWFAARPFVLVRRWLRLVNLLLEEWFRHTVERRARQRGAIVLLDRHFFFDYYSHDIIDAFGPRAPLRRLHGLFLRLLPRPTLTVLLDAPPEVLFARKPEGNIRDLAIRRAEYLQIRRLFPEVMIVDVTRPAGEVREDIFKIIMAARASR